MTQWQPNVWELIRGNDEQILVHILDHDGVPLNITGATEIALKVPLGDGTTLRKVAGAGFSYGLLRPIFIFGFAFTAAETQQLALKVNQTVQLELTFGTAIKTCHIPNALTVTDRVLP